MRKIFSILVALCALLQTTLYCERTTRVLDEDWQFSMGQFDGEFVSLRDFDASKWSAVCVPHDWAISHPFSLIADMQQTRVVADGETRIFTRTGRTGALPSFGEACYRTEFDIASTERGKRVFLEFDGAMSNSKIYANGVYVGGRPYGYSSFCVDITDFVNFGARNAVAVLLNPKPQSSRWYTGAGLYREVRLVVKPKNSIAYSGVFVRAASVSKESAQIAASAKIECLDENLAKTQKLRRRILDFDGKILSESVVALSDKNSADALLKLPEPKLWDINTPNLYVLETAVLDEDGSVADLVKTRFGVRTIEFDRERGFVLNGKSVEIKGVCLHHDLGPIGAETNVSAIRRQLKILREMGCNAIRTSHNPPSPQFLDVCDETGFLVMDEAFDEWRKMKCQNGYHTLFDEWAQRDLADFIRRDRNHPSVIIWSVGNEVGEQYLEDGWKTAKYLVDIARKEDPTRPVSAGMNTPKLESFMSQFDLQGLNYQVGNYANLMKKYPKMIFFGSETESCISSRGAYHFPVVRSTNRYLYDCDTLSSYDLCSPQWGYPPDLEFEAHSLFGSKLFGSFVWTGFDYLGEPIHGNMSSGRSSSYGILDLAGMPKDRYYLYKSVWNPKSEVLHLLPHWNLFERRGEKVPVFCYTTFPKVELFVNGKSMGVKSKNPESKNVYERYRIMWDDVIFKEGEIKVVAYSQDGAKLAEKSVKTAGRVAKLRLSAERQSICSDGKDLCFITVEALDKDGNFCPTASNTVFFKVEGAAKFKAACNGSESDLSSFAEPCMRLFNGKLTLVIQAKKAVGIAKVSATSGNIGTSELNINVGRFY